MTKVHAYLARIKDQEKDVIAVPDGAGRALCVSFDKHWTFTREWSELHIIAPLVEGAAEARTTPAVTREEVWRVVAAHDPGDDEMALCRVNRLTDAVCRLFGVDAEPVDPVEAKARVEADRRYSGTLNHAFVEGAMWATRHVLEQEAGDG